MCGYERENDNITLTFWCDLTDHTYNQISEKLLLCVVKVLNGYHSFSKVSALIKQTEVFASMA